MIFIVEIDDYCSADEVVKDFHDDFDSIDRYEKNLLFKSGGFVLFLILV